MITKMNNEWTKIEEAIKMLSKTYNPDSVKFLLDFGYEEADMTTNEELDELDIYDALQAVFLSIIDVALQEEKFELINLVNKAHEKQAIIMKRALDEMMLTEDEREEDFWHLHFTNEYFHNSKQNLATNYGK